MGRTADHDRDLSEPARATFWGTYGPVDERRRLLDEPPSILYGLLAALRLPKLPRWGEACLEEARSGRLETALRQAVAGLS